MKPRRVDLDPSIDSRLPAWPADPEVDDPDLDALTYDRVSTVFGSIERSGNWDVADRTRARAVLGNLVLDYREAELPPDGMIEVQCDIILGQIELIVPVGAEVDMQGVTAFMSESKHQSQRGGVRPFLRRVLTGEEPQDERRPGRGLLFVITGRVILGGVTVTSRPA